MFVIVTYWEVVQVVPLVCFLPILEEILQQNYSFSDVCWVARPNQAPSIFKLGPRAHLTSRRYIWKKKVPFCNVGLFCHCQHHPVGDLGKTSAEKSRLLLGIARISETSPPNSGNLVLFFPDIKTMFYAYDRKKVPMMIMLIAMIIIMIVMMVILMIMMKKWPKNIQILWLFSKNVPI